MSLIGVTLTMPGVAGIVLTLGMAIDANVLICERVREELRNGSSPHASIRAGYEKAWSTILDANVTHLIARSEAHTSELQSLMRISYAVFCLKKKHTPNQTATPTTHHHNTRSRPRHRT